MKKTITWATLQRRIDDGLVRQTGTLHSKGKTYAQLVEAGGRPLTVQVTGVLVDNSAAREALPTQREWMEQR